MRDLHFQAPKKPTSALATNSDALVTTSDAPATSSVFAKPTRFSIWGWETQGQAPTEQCEGGDPAARNAPGLRTPPRFFNVTFSQTCLHEMFMGWAAEVSEHLSFFQVDCVMSDWMPWSQCTASCGGKAFNSQLPIRAGQLKRFAS